MTQPSLQPISFPDTPWSLVARAGAEALPSQREALRRLLERYLDALRVHLRLRHRLSHHDAQDLLQEFVLRKVLEQEMIAKACRQRGKFRTFLLTALDHFVIDQWRHDHAAARAPDAPMVDLEEGIRGDARRAAPGGDGDAFTVEWGRRVLQLSLDQMRAYCRQSGQDHVWQVFDARLIQPMLAGADPLPYERLAEQLGLGSAVELANLLVTGKRMFRRTVRAVIGEYAADEAEVDQEMRDLMTAFGAAGAE